MKDIPRDPMGDAFDIEQKARIRKQRMWKIPLLIVVGLMLLALITMVVIWCVNVFALTVQVHGGSELYVEYGSEYTDLGASAQFSGSLLLRQPQDVTVTSTGSIDTMHLGERQITYTAEHIQDFGLFKKHFVQESVRTVHVVDTQPPQITLVADPNGYTLPGRPYEEEGFSANDFCDGDLTHLVEREEKEGAVVYTVTDVSGNTTQVTRQIVYNDPIPPELVLAGGDTVTLVQGAPYVEPGYGAYDNCDGNISDKVACSGSVDTNTIGTYTLQYSVSDNYQNNTTVTRTVHVIAGVQEANPLPQLAPAQPLPVVTPPGKVIYLTFDDGPGAHTERLLDILDQYGVKATFFVVNTGYMHLLPRMVASGHAVAMHTATHRYEKLYANEHAYFSDLQTIQNAIQAQTGAAPTILRFPGGSSNVISKRYNRGLMTRLTTKIKELGYRYFDWNVDSGDAGKSKSSGEVYMNVTTGVSKRDVSVVLMHDIYGYTVDAVADIVEWGIARGYTFLPLDASSPECEHPINN